MVSIRTFETIAEMSAYLGFNRRGKIVEEDIDFVETDCDWFERKRRDAEVLSTIAANSEGDIIEFGTSFGRGTSELAENLGARGTVHTVNILAEQASPETGSLVTHFLSKEEIGSYYRDKGISNVNQIYSDTVKWSPDNSLKGAVSAAFVDAAHDDINVLLDSRKVVPLLKSGGFLIWHDFNPARRGEKDWIDAVMRGVEAFISEQENILEVLHLRNSWMGVARIIGGNFVGEEKGSRRRGPIGGSEKVLVGYSHYRYPTDVGEANEAWLGRMREVGFNVEGMCLTIDPPADCLNWEQLDSAWRSREPKLIKLYSEIVRAIEESGATIFVNYNGINIHPEFVTELRRICTMVYCCFDDPESTAWLSRPVAPYYDVAMVGNIAELDMYRSWGCRHVEWLPIGFRDDEVLSSVSEKTILECERPFDISIICERLSPWRQERLDRMAQEFPHGIYRGPGWPDGFISEDQKITVMSHTRIGFNLHNSTGPINYRTFTVPANGGMLLCDNSHYLGKIFDLGVEAIGYDYLDEAIFKAKFYLGKERWRREIAAAGYLRVHRDYTEKACFGRILKAVETARSKARQIEVIANPRPVGMEPFRTHQIEFELDRNRYIDREILSRGTFEEQTSKLVESFVKPGMRWLDIGANIGYFTMLLARLSTETGRGWAWEPTPHLASHLRRHAAINGYSDRFSLRQRALGDSCHTAQIGFDDVSATMHWPTASGPTQKVDISVDALDNDSDVLGEAGIDLIKIDIDGHEPFFFRGAYKFFQKHRPIIAMEFANLNLTVAGESVSTLIAELDKVGYVPISEKTLQPYPDALNFLIECGNYAFSANCWAIPKEILIDVGSFVEICNQLPRSMVNELSIFASTRDHLLWKNLSPGRDRRVRLRAIGGNEVLLRGGTSDATVLWDTFHFKYHVPPQKLPTGAVILDLGANVGLTSAEMAWSNPESRIIAVELDPDNVQMALINTSFLGGRVEVVHAGIWTEDGTIDYGGESQQGFSIGSSVGNSRSAPSIRVARLLRDRGISWVDYMKMDIEGAELAVLEDAEDWIGMVGALKVEIHQMEEFDRVWTLLESYGFTCSKEKQHYCCIEAIRVSH